MTVPRAESAAAFTIAALVLATAGVLLVYGAQFDTGLYYDDYHFLRPVHPLELRRVWYGSWDPAGIESAFFRPITAWLFAFRFWAFGLNAQALHAISLAGHVVCAVSVGWLLRREGAPASVGLIAVWLYAIHPIFPYAQVSWLTNQMHLAESSTVILALLVWQSVRDRHAGWSVVLLPVAATAFLIKEDAVMLLPVLLALTMLRAWLVHPAQRTRLLALVPAAGLAVTALIAFRHQRLGRLGGYGLPGVDQAQVQFWKGLDATLLLWPTRSPWQAIATLIAISVLVTLIASGRWMGNKGVAMAWCAVIVLLAFSLPALSYEITYPLVTWQGIASGLVIAATVAGGGLAAKSQFQGPLLVLMTGLVITIGFNVPFALVSKREQYHLLALGASVLLAGIADAVRCGGGRMSRYLLPVALVVSMPLALLATAQAADFRPCAPIVLSADRYASEWPVLPSEIRSWLTQKQERCGTGQPPGALTELPVISWGLHGEGHAEGGQIYRWTSDRAVLLLRRQTRSVSLAFRSPDAGARTPVLVTVNGGAEPIEVALDSGDWKAATVRLSDGLGTMFRAAHRVDISVTPWFVPAVRDPSQTDLKRYGVHFRMIENRVE